MPKIVILPHQDLCPDGAVLEANSGETILDAALRNGIEIEHACEKSCACTTCHCIVREGFDSLPESSEQEDDMLDKAWGLEPESRLSCQARVTDEDGHGLLIESARPGTDLALSLLPYDTLTIEAATHQDELPKPRHMFLRMLAGQMGVGGDDSWGAPVHDRYQLDAARELTLDVTMRLV